MLVSLKGYTAALGFGTIIGWATFFSVLIFTSPEAGTAGILLFLGSLFLGLMGSFTLGGLWIRIRKRQRGSEQQFRAAFRQGFSLAVFIIALLLLRRHQIFNWLSAGGIFALMLFIEIIISRHKHAA